MIKNKLMISTSGIRGIVGYGLDPLMAAKFAAAFGTIIKRGRIVVGRDTRPSGEIYQMAVISGLRAVGLGVVDIGVVPTPTVEIAIKGLKAAGGICITASHNPSEWNALKFFNKNGEFIDKKTLGKIKEYYSSDKISFKDYRNLGPLKADHSWIDKHINQILKLRITNRNKIKRANLKVVVDAINGAGSIALPSLLEKLGVEVIRLNCESSGDFVHLPEPTPANLQMLSAAVKRFKADIGMACDPDADRLALIDNTGRPLSEELTLALAVKFVLAKQKGRVVVNLSTSRVTETTAGEMGEKTFYTPVGEANVIEGIRKHKAVIGGEGNGGIIYPAFHSGRDALLGAALVLSFLAESKMSLSELVGTMPIYSNIKLKRPLPERFERKLQKVENAAKKGFDNLKIDGRDGLRFDFSRGWFQIRKSNTEPIYRLIVETDSRRLTDIIKNRILNLLK